MHQRTNPATSQIKTVALGLMVATSAQWMTSTAAHASLQTTTPINAALLAKIPLFPGLEAKGSSEDKQTKILIDIFTSIQAEAQNKAKDLNRATHAKGLCYSGSLEIFSAADLKSQQRYSDSIIQRIQKGLFSKSARMKTLIRFANAKGERNADTVGDVRGLSFSIDTSGQQKSVNGDNAQDFMMNSTPMFLVKNIGEFAEVMKTARVFQGDLRHLPNPFHIGDVLKAKNLLERFERNDTLSYATENYWSNLPYSHGVNRDGTASEVVKYKVTPCDGGGDRHESSSGKASNYLQTEIDQRAARGEVCFDLQVQLFDKKQLASAGLHPKWSTQQWIENGGELWDESVLPFYTVARLSIAGDGEGATQSSQRVACEKNGFSTLLHSTRAHQPLGSIARVRARVEENSRARRAK